MCVLRVKCLPTQPLVRTQPCVRALLAHLAFAPPIDAARTGVAAWPIDSFDRPAVLQVRKLGPKADPAILKTLPLASGAMWLFYLS